MFRVHHPHAALPLARGMPHIRALGAGVPGLGVQPGSALSRALCSGPAVPVPALTAPSLPGQGHASLLREG